MDKIIEKEVHDLIDRVKRNEKKQSKIIKITLEFDDHYIIFDGEDAEKWLNAADNAAAFSSVHGVDYFKYIDFDKGYMKK